MKFGRVFHLQFVDRTREYGRGSFADDQKFRRSILVKSLCVLSNPVFPSFTWFYCVFIAFYFFFFRGKGWRPESLCAF